MINVVREKVKKFLTETLGAKEISEEIRVIGIDNANGVWTAEAEVIERNLTLPGYRVFEKKCYIVKLSGDLEVSSYKQVKSADREQNRNAEAMSANDRLYVYGVVDKLPAQLDIVGIDKRHNVYPVVRDDICVMVSEVDIEQFQDQVKHLVAELTNNTGNLPSDTGAILQAHENVMVALMQDTTVVPLKFGTILQDVNAVLKMLQDQEEQFKSLLLKFAGKVEWGLKAYINKCLFSNYVVQTEPKFADLQSKMAKLSRGVAYLCRRKWEEEVEEYVTDQSAAVAEEIFQDLGEEAFEARLNDILPQTVTGKKQEMILNAAYLVARHNIDHLFQRGTSFMKRYAFMGLDLEFSGPWPPYNFT